MNKALSLSTDEGVVVGYNKSVIEEDASDDFNKLRLLNLEESHMFAPKVLCSRVLAVISFWLWVKALLPISNVSDPRVFFINQRSCLANSKHVSMLRLSGLRYGFFSPKSIISAGTTVNTLDGLLDPHTSLSSGAKQGALKFDTLELSNT